VRLKRPAGNGSSARCAVIRQIMDDGKVLLVNLAKGRMGEDSSSLLGALLVTTIGLAAYSRADTAAPSRRDFFVYIDEFQTFTTLSLANMLAESRKYRVSFAMANQFLFQIEPDIRHVIFGNVGTLLSFRVGAEGAQSQGRQHVGAIVWPLSHAPGSGR
jgi:type IV secretory pathway TraG/TraD family ATPase VirD4